MFAFMKNFIKRLGFPTCSWCQHPTMGKTLHVRCEAEADQAYEEYLAQQSQDDEAELQVYLEEQAKVEEAEYRLYQDEVALQELMDSFCKATGCYEESLYSSGLCEKHLSEAHERDEDFDELEDDFYEPEDEICSGICGQPSYACTCAETESYRAFQADPETRGSFWVA